MAFKFDVRSISKPRFVLKIRTKVMPSDLAVGAWWIFLASVAACIYWMTPYAQARSIASINSRVHFKKLEPCDGDFEMSMDVRPVEAISGDPVGLKLKIAKNSSSFGEVGRTHINQKNPFDKEQCEQWQTKYWHLLEHLVLENKFRERDNVICRNTADISYRQGSFKNKARVCLASNSRDGVTWAFQRFYRGTDELVSR